jgi:hypothetical protein
MVILKNFKKQILRTIHTLFNFFFPYFHMLVELCASNYATFDGLVNELMTFLKHQQHIVKKPLYG